MNTVKLLDRIVPFDGKRSRIEAIRDMYLYYRFTLKQKRAIEMFLFEPTKENAYKAMDITPKAWLFIRYAISEDEIVARVGNMIEDGELNGTYIRVIITNEDLKDLLKKLMQHPRRNRLEKKILEYTMILKLKK